MRALDWSSGTRGPSYSRDAVVCDYVMLLGRTPYRGLRRLEKKGSRLPPEVPLTPVEAVLKVAKIHRFPTTEACRGYLVRARCEIKAESRRAGGGIGRLVSDFPVPNQVKLDRA
jgi:hypothetical protein